jgi:hypothetical protein
LGVEYARPAGGAILTVMVTGVVVLPAEFDAVIV